MAEWKSRIRLAWAALRGQLRGGIYISPIDISKARFQFESCRIEQRIGKGMPLLQFDPSWKDGAQEWRDQFGVAWGGLTWTDRQR